jgi:CRISPR-associated exonuclease Cas4
MMSATTKDELINVSAINQYLYCPRRYWYIEFFDTIGMNYPLRDGLVKHENKSLRGDWIEELILKIVRSGSKAELTYSPRRI